jgi:hypothetical protein
MLLRFVHLFIFSFIYNLLLTLKYRKNLSNYERCMQSHRV